MAARRQYRLNLLSRVADREAGATWAIRLVREQLDRGESSLHGYSDRLAAGVRLAAQFNDERTVLLLYTEFEDAVREAYRGILRRNQRPQMETLLRVLRDRVGVPQSVYTGANRVRVCRNAIVHQNEPATMTTAEAKSSLSRFLACLPEWT